jgi:hypothetical protein
MAFEINPNVVITGDTNSDITMIGTGSTNVAGFNRSKGSKPSAVATDNPNYHVPNNLLRYVLIRDVSRVHS